ncbi:universal stress protein [Ulvibacter litoralis]|uniref:Universal stress protein family protein n=1 Tax=Ulvibacter litoralis TaxID=227084 RepID=A0A1G7CRI8_9FLAO|nr:universal stress protein [Ulvibacter litoralis]GHC46587.1 hypothetical protein GCM10008083_07050 [Ulvibacter litoralis]SDE41276.1 hypothetical protein SAMN05421855_101491 [Ulvibacter litoralis]
MKKILIPTDFTVESLQLVEYAILNFPNTKLEIILIAGYKLPDTRWEVTHFKAKEQFRKQLSNEFIAYERRLILEHENHIEAISFELFTGINSYSFQNFLKQLDVEDAVVPKGAFSHSPNHKWFDTTKYLKKCVNNVVEVSLDVTDEEPQRKFSLVSLFNS